MIENKEINRTFEKYPEYKDSGVEWLGEIPSHWEIRRMASLGRFSASGIDKLSIRGESLVKIINYTDVYKNSKFLLNTEFQYMTVTTPESNRVKHLVEKGDLIFLPSSETFEDLGLSALVDEDLENVSFSYHVLRFRFNTNVSHRFKRYLLNNPLILNEFSRKGTGSIRKTLSRNDFRNTEVVLPPYLEQTTIANFLDDKTSKIDTAIAQKEQMIALLKERKQIVIQNAVTGKWSMVNGKWGETPKEKIKDSGVEWIGEIPEEWEVMKFRFVFNLSKGLTITKQNLQDVGIPCVNYGEIHSKYGFDVDPLINDLQCVDEGYLLSDPNSLLKRGDFIFADTSEDIEGSGNFTYLNSDEKTFAGYHTIIARTKFDVNSRFLAYSFDSISFRNQIRKRMNGVKVYSITQSKLKETSVWLPSPIEQEQIVEYLDKACAKYDESITLQQSQIEKLKEYKATLIDSAVTGKIKVTGE